MMTEEEICHRFRYAKNRREEIRILADLTASDAETIIEILRSHGLCVRVCKCRRCKQKYKQYLSLYCEPCGKEIAAEAEARRIQRKVVKDRLKRNTVLILSHQREIARITAENEELRAELGGGNAKLPVRG